MARMTRRQSARLGRGVSGSPALTSTTGTTAGDDVSPVFSTRSTRPSSPATSLPEDEDDELDMLSPKKKKRTAADVDSDDLDGEDDVEENEEEEEQEAVRRAPKRRATANRAYVEVTSRASVTVKDKGKGKAKAVTPSVEDESDFDEPAFSASSGSEFEASSDEEQEGGADDYADDSEEEAEQLRRAVDRSRRAGAAERRIGSSQVVDDSEMMDVDSDEEDEVDDEPLASKKKGKSKSKAKAGARAGEGKVMTLQDLRAAKKEQRNAKRAEMAVYRDAEKKLRKELGRKLTMAEKTQVALHHHHPELRDVWGDLRRDIPVIEPIEAEQPEQLKVQLLPFQRESLYWMKKQEEGVWKGGMLADEMGMGKTIQIISLFITEGKKPNLVVAPTVAIMQWRNEIEAHTSPPLKVLVWHGSSRESDVKSLKSYDVVLTTYAVLESSFRKQVKGFTRKNKLVKEKSPVHQIEWERIVLDEAHNIKERSTNTAKAAFALKAKFRWCLSGTPLQNRVGELYSLVRFLGGDPFSYYFCKRCDCKSLHWKFSDKRTCDDCGHSPMQHTCLWNNEILTPIQKHGMEAGSPGEKAFKKLKILLDRMMLRRTKLQRADDLGLPPRTVIVRRDHFSPEERELYLSLFSDAKRQFTTYLDQGTVLNNYSNIFSLLTRMRQMACHPDLVLRSKTSTKNFQVEAEEEGTVCRLCNDFAEDAVQSKCRHVFDRECMRMYLEGWDGGNVPDCPVCHVPLTVDLEAPALEINANASTKENTGAVNVKQGILGRLNLATWRSSSKIEMLVEELSNLRAKEAATKSIVFSQFVNFLDLIAFRLQRAGFRICRLEGTMSPQARDATIKHFMNNVEVTVFLVSLKAGGVALNLTEASRVYLMDSWWNPAVEYQAMDRIHRLGQHRPVQAIKLVVEDSIESRIVQLQEKKSAMVDATLSKNDEAMGRLTPEDALKRGGKGGKVKRKS